MLLEKLPEHRRAGSGHVANGASDAHHILLNGNLAHGFAAMVVKGEGTLLASAKYVTTQKPRTPADTHDDAFMMRPLSVHYRRASGRRNSTAASAI